MDFSRLEQYIKALPSKNIPACDLIVYQNHKEIFRCMAGHSDYEGKVPVSDKDLYNIYSNTKVFTVVATMQLVEQGKLSLEDNLSDYIPEYREMYYKTKNGTEKATNPITIYNLLTMTSGLGYDAIPSVDKFLSENPNATTLEAMAAIANEPLNFNPSTRWKYGRSHDVLGAVIEVVSGMRFGEYLKKYIMEPLGIKNATFDFYNDYVKEHISAYYKEGPEHTAIPIENKGSNLGRNIEGGGQGLLCQTDEYILLMDALANGGVGKTGNRILSEESIEKIKNPELDAVKMANFCYSHGKMGYSYGLGVRTLVDKSYGARSPIGEFAWDGMTGGYGLVDTDNKIAVCYMQNISGSSYAWRTIFPETRDLIYEILGIE